MWLKDLIINNQPALLMLIGTVSGVIIAETGHLLSKWVDHRNKLKLRRLDMAVELEKKYLIEPVVSFIDRDLALMQTTYAKIFELKEEKERFSIDSTHVFELSAVQARVKSIGDPHLNDKFEEFSRIRICIGTAVSDAKTEEAYKELNKAIISAGEILELLFKRLKKIEN